MKKIAWIGVGIMGTPMVEHLLKAGFQVHITARNRAKVEGVIQAGAVFHDTIGQCVQGCQAVVTMVGYPKDVEEVYFAPGNILDRAEAGAYLIDMTTTSPALAQRLAAEGTKRGFRVLDAPVTGGDVGARAGTLSILVGGAADDFAACLPLFQAMGTNITHQGGAGCGQHAKLANQIMIAGTLSGLCEAVAYARAQGLDGEKLLAALATGAAGSRQLDTLGGKILAGDDAPGFYLKHFVKDMGLAREEARSAGLTLEVLEQALASCAALEAAGLGERGTQALIHHYQPKP